MAALATQSVVRTGLEATYASCTGGGDTFLPGDDVFIHIKNGHSSPQTVTIVTPKNDPLGNAVADNAVVVTNAEERLIGPFPRGTYADPTTGRTSLTYSGVTALTIAICQIARP